MGSVCSSELQLRFGTKRKALSKFKQDDETEDNAGEKLPRSAMEASTIKSNHEVSFYDKDNSRQSSHLADSTHKDDTCARSGRLDTQDRLSILHFNDVYDINESSKEPVGGAARFASLFNTVADKAKADCRGTKPLVLFGGDCLNPSILSSATKGTHMVEVLNYLKVDAAVFGNHEFDFGVDHVATCTKCMNFPWFLSNVTENITDAPFGDGEVKRIIKWGDLKLGIIGLIEEEWLETLTTVDRSELSFTDYVERGNELGQQLKDDGADIVIALTHMRWPNDTRLAKEVKSIDLILGGHDHEYGVKNINDSVIVKSGSDFKTFSLVDLYFKKDGTFDVYVTRYDVTKAVKEDEQMRQIVLKYMTVLNERLRIPIGEVKTPLDGLYEHVRSRETNLGNFVADIMRTTTRAEIVLLNSGTFRSNYIHDSGPFTVGDLMSILPIHDNVVVIKVTGQQLLAGLENAVSKFPAYEGRFAQVSGFYFGFNPKAPAGKRVVQESIRIHGEPLNLKREYALATKAYVARGRDGYHCFSSCSPVNDPDNGPLVSTIVRNHIANVSQLLNYEERTGDKLKVVNNGQKIISEKDGGAHEVYSSLFDDTPVGDLQKSMEMIMPRHVDINDNNLPLKNSTSSESRLRRGGSKYMQHLIEINRDTIFDDSTTVTGPIEMARRRAIAMDEYNLKLLKERQKSHEDVRWQILPLIEGRIFHI